MVCYLIQLSDAEILFLVMKCSTKYHIISNEYS